MAAGVGGPAGVGGAAGTGAGAPQRERERTVRYLALAGVIAYGFVGWPLFVLARRSLMIHMAQQCALLLAVAPLVVTSFGGRQPAWLVAERRLGRLVRSVSAPVPATLVFNLVVIASFVPAVMNPAVRDPAVGAALDIALLTAGVVMWTPALTTSPISHGLRRPVRAGYLIVQSIVPSFASLVFIFDRNPVYQVFRQAPHSLGLTPIVDQQLAGALAKIVGLAVMLGAAGAILLRSDPSPDEAPDAAPDAMRPGNAPSTVLPEVLTWADVEEELRRVGFRESGDG